MFYLQSLYFFVTSNAFLTTLVVAWLFWRIAKFEERKSILGSLNRELEVHSQWMNGEYFTNTISDKSWKDPKYIVFKLSTIAIDNAISKGPSVFLNKRLVTDLTFYRQKVNAFNQLVEASLSLQSSPDLWGTKPSQRLVDRMIELTCTIHWYGIGNSLELNSAHNAFGSVLDSFNFEKESRIVTFIWFLLSVNLFSVKTWLIRYL